MLPDTVMQVITVKISGTAEGYQISCMPNSVSSAEKKKCRVSLDAPYSSVIAALSQNESAELRISVLKILQVFFFGWIPIHHALSAVCLHKGWSCQVLGYVEYQDVANFSLFQLFEVEVKIGAAVHFGGQLCLLTTAPPELSQLLWILNISIPWPQRNLPVKEAMPEKGSYGISQST